MLPSLNRWYHLPVNVVEIIHLAEIQVEKRKELKIKKIAKKFIVTLDSRV